MLRTIALIAMILPATAAYAGCTVQDFMFWPERNDNVVVDTHVEAGTVCEHAFAEGPGYRFTRLSVARQPEQGRAAMRGRTLVFRPSPQFRGKDFYQVKICAVKEGGGRGCSNLFFVATIE